LINFDKYHLKGFFLFKGLPKLTYLDISNNQITDFILLVSTLKQYAQNLNNLNIISNPFNKVIKDFH
jgi:Leucine-rich repeat (LRR) protein